ncbi:cell division protease FtsH [Roseimicrobium gellanilyticum]|uniref:ATP-dependent zinc metalloprotease FtsH n=1 Tax=Roseimicrobium gellanilyticum TaxID=748857 RepID=A0A366HEB5_9BACT|nr:ATP-dependent zinc metalloprotease FtsH [Roseimicrobium gellanilyticum]RBP40400.1 cell division protease FtsH [Roseimicrobium gellanilyticum]
MFEDEPNQQRNNNRKTPEPQFNWKGLILLVASGLIIAWAFILNSDKGGMMQSGREKNYPEFQQLALDGKIICTKDKPLRLVSDPGTGNEYLEGYYTKESTTGDKASTEAVFETTVNVEFQKDQLNKLIADVNAQNAEKRKTAKDAGQPEPTLYDLVITPKTNTSHMGTFLFTLLPLIVLVGLFLLIRQQMKMAGRGALSFGKSRAKLLNQDRNRITFKDVAGCDEAKEEVWELVEFLKDPKKFQRLGGKIPKGVLLVGPPGTGKTLLAKAIAGEADVPFFSISGSDFVEMFVGVGASRVRDMFEQGKKNAPCLIFIDEIDAVGRHRGHGLGGGHDEREQTLNAMLVEMDGFDTQEGVIIIAATNRPDVLDPALLRPGRFDRQVMVSLPDVKGREEILRVHAKKVKLSEDADLSKVSRGTPGFSGAELANVINEAALLAARRNLKSIGTAELEEARDKVRWGRERRSLALTDKEKENTAYHEAGHAILIELLEHTDPLHKVTIIPRGPSLGSTMWLPEQDKFNHRKNELLDNLVVAMGGRVAEEIQFHNVTNGAMGDIRQATGIARSMVCAWGMSEKLGMVEYGEQEGQVFLARDLARNRNYSEATAQIIDEEVKRLIDEAYNKAMSIIVTHKDKLDAIALALLEFETLDGAHIKEIMEHGRILHPPQSPKPPTPPPVPKATPERTPAKSEDESEGGLPGGVVGVPA